MAEVAADPAATADQIVEAGSAVDAARVESTTLVTYTVHQNTSEGRSAGAWRLYDAGGKPIATQKAGVTGEGAATPSVTAAHDGYVVRHPGGSVWYVSLDGTREKATHAARPLQPEFGDIPLEDGTTRLFRPRSRTVFVAAPRAGGNWQGWTVTGDGTVWVQRLGKSGRVPFDRSTPDGDWERAATYSPAARGHWANSLALTAVGDRVVVPVSAEDREDIEDPTLVGLLVRRSDAPAGQPWDMLEAKVSGTGWWDLRADVVDETTVAIGTWGEAPYLVNLDDGTWRLAPTPTGGHGWDFDIENGSFYATHREHADAWVSGDHGENWYRLPH